MVRVGLLIIALSVMALPSASLAQETRTATPGAPSPSAHIGEFAWLAGAWEGRRLTGPDSRREAAFRYRRAGKQP